MCCLEEDTGASGGAHQDCGPAFAHLHMLCILLGDACVALQATGSCLRAQPGSGDALRKASSLYITEQDTSKIQPAEHAAFRCALSTADNDSENIPVSTQASSSVTLSRCSCRHDGFGALGPAHLCQPGVLTDLLQGDSLDRVVRQHLLQQLLELGGHAKPAHEHHFGHLQHNIRKAAVIALALKSTTSLQDWTRKDW